MTCSNELKTGCLSCSSVNYRVQYNNECICQASYYDDGTNSSLCKACNSQCYECSGISNNCTSCDNSNHREFAMNQCLCSIGYFDIGDKVCQICDYYCYECNQNANNCTSCNNANTFRYLSANQCPCSNHYFDNQASNAVCDACHYSCQTCQNVSSNCTSCDQIVAHRKLNGIVCSCEDGFANNGTNQVCVPCHYTCLVCQGDSENDCLQCDTLTTHRIYQSLNNTCPCVENYYNVANQKICAQCHTSCLTCSGSEKENCLSCNSTAFRNLSGNVCICQDGYFPVDNEIICQKCNESCKTCNNSNLEDACTSCDVDSILHPTPQGKCLKCSQNYVLDAFYNCIPCYEYCSTCLPNDTYHCLTCKDSGQNPVNGTCCAVNCHTCEKQNQAMCLSCKISSNFVDGNMSGLCISRADECSNGFVGVFGNQNINNPGVNQCLPECPEGTIINLENLCGNYSLQNMTVGCKEYNNLTDCIKCQEGLYLTENLTCIKLCQLFHSNFYNNIETGQCKECPHNCEFCLGAGVYDCISLQCSITHTLSIGLVNTFDISLTYSKLEIDISYQNTIEQALSKIKSNVLKYIDFSFYSHSQNVNSSLIFEDNSLVVDFFDSHLNYSVLQDNLIFTLLANKINNSISQTNEDNASLILLYAPMQFTYFDIKQEQFYDQLEILIDQTLVTSEACYIKSQIAISKTKFSSQLNLEINNLKETQPGFQFLNTKYLKLLINITIEEFEGTFSYQFIQQTEDNSYKKFLIDLEFSNTFANSPKLIITFCSNLLQKYCAIVFQPEQIEIQLDNYYKLSEDQQQLQESINQVSQNAGTSVEMAQSALSFMPGSMMFASNSYQMNQMIFIHLITTKRPDNINSQKQITGNVIPQIKYLKVTENTKDKGNLEGQFKELDYPCYCLNVFSTSLILLAGIVLIGKSLLYIKYKSKNNLNSLVEKVFNFVVWKLAIICYFLSQIGISLFTWENIIFMTYYSFSGILNFITALLAKLLQFYFYYYIATLILGIKKFTTLSIVEKFQKYYYNKNFDMLFVDYDYSSIQSLIYPLQEMLKIELLSVFTVTLHLVPNLQIILLISVLLINQLSYLSNRPFKKFEKTTLTTFNDSFIIIESSVFYLIMQIPIDDLSMGYQIGNIYCFLLTLQKITTCALYLNITKSQLIYSQSNPAASIENLETQGNQAFKQILNQLERIK